MMRRMSIVLFALAFFTPAAAPAHAAPGLMLGDSIGVGLSLASGVKRLAHNSVTIGRDDILGQIAQVPAGTVAFLSLGTNDAVGSIAGVSARIDKVLAAVDAAGVSAVWVGPVCVIKPWNSTVSELDGILRKKLAGRMPYVSVAGESFCDTSIRGHDGVHFTFAGYGRIWAMARAASGVQIEGSAFASAGVKAVKKTKKHKKKKGKKRQKTAALEAASIALPRRV